MKHYTITTEDVGKAHIRAFGKTWPVNWFLGRILTCDVGKRVYLRGGVLQVENEEQHMARIANRLCQALHNHNPADYDSALAAPRCGCPTGCGMIAVLHLFRVTAYVHESPIYENVATVFCAPCGGDALESGLYCAGDDLLEPHHGPGCIERMQDDTGQPCDSRCREWPMNPCPIHKGGQS